MNVVFSPDGSCVAPGSKDMTVLVWDVQTGEELLCYDAHNFNGSDIVENGQVVSILERPSHVRTQFSSSSSTLDGKLGITGEWITWN